MEKEALAQLSKEKYKENSMLNRDRGAFSMEKVALVRPSKEKYEEISMLNCE